MAFQGELEKQKEERIWRQKAEKLNELHRELQGKPDAFKLGYIEDPGGILNAYREGDISFEDAVEAIDGWSARNIGKLVMSITTLRNQLNKMNLPK